MINDIMSFMENYGFNILFGVIALVSIILFLSIMSKKKKRTALFSIEKDLEETIDHSVAETKNPYIKLRKKVELIHIFNPSQKRSDIIYYSIMISEALLFLIFLFMQKFLLAILLPIILHFLATKAIEMYTRSIHDYIQAELPTAIRHFIKVMTRMSDMRMIMYEAGKNLREPLHSSFLDASRKMTSESTEKVLMELADRLQNSWVHAFVFILSSYKESSRKEDIIANLALLANIIDEENRLAERAVVEKKGVVMLNWTLVGLGVTGFIANLIWLPVAYDFFFKSAGGMMALLFGFLGLCLTVIVNIVLSKKSI